MAWKFILTFQDLANIYLKDIVIVAIIIIIIICGSFNDAVSSSDYISSDDRMINERVMN
jgi:hypothetical protein